MLLVKLALSFTLNDIFMFIGLAFMAIALIFLITTFIIAQVRAKKHEKDINEAANSLRVFIIDANNDEVRYFNRSKLQRKKTSTITAFYNQFPADERYRIITWIGNLLDDVPDTPKYLEINVLINQNKKSFFSILQVSKVDHQKNLIYLESYILKYMFVKKNNSVQVRKFSSREKFLTAMNTNNQFKGVTIGINFYNKRTLVNEIPHLIFAQIKNVLVKYITPYRLMLENGDNQIIVSDLKVSQRTSMLALINTIRIEISRLLLIYSEEQIGFSFGIAENKHFYNQGEQLIQTITELCEIAKEDGKEFLIYEQGKKMDSENDALHYRTEVERIIQDKKIRYLYRPIYNIGSGRMLGYQASFEPLDSLFDSIDELKSYAVRTDDDKELFATIARNSISRFIQEKDGAMLKLFFPLSVNELTYVNRTFAHISSIKDANIVLILSEDDLLNLPRDSSESMIQIIKTFKSKGYDIALLLNDNEAALNSVTYEVFDFFLLSVSSHITNRKLQNRQLPSFQALIEKLLRYHKPIIAINIPTWSMVEYVIKLGIDIISSDAVAPFDQNVLPLNKKAVSKLKTMN